MNSGCDPQPNGDVVGVVWCGICQNLVCMPKQRRVLVVIADSTLEDLHGVTAQIVVVLHPMVERRARFIDVELCIGGLRPRRWQKGTRAMTEFTMDAEYGRAPTIVYTVILANTERCKR
jgi:hypothetical protein